jgi:sulfate/thiosulfate transport system permease protein
VGGRAAMTWVYVGWLIGLPAFNLIYQASRFGPTALWIHVTSPDALRSMIVTLVVAMITVVINTVFGILLALTLARQKFRGHTALSVLTDLPLTISPVVVGLLVLTLYKPTGWLGMPLESAGVRIINAMPAILIASLFVTFPFVTRELTPLLAQIGHEQEDAATTLGASPWQAFWRVTVPSVRHGLTRGVSLTFARSIGEFGAAVVVSGNIIGETQTLTLWVYQEASDFNLAGAYAGSLVLGILSVLAFALAERSRTRSTRKRNDLLTRIR